MFGNYYQLYKIKAVIFHGNILFGFNDNQEIQKLHLIYFLCFYLYDIT